MLEALVSFVCAPGHQGDPPELAGSGCQGRADQRGLV